MRQLAGGCAQNNDFPPLPIGQGKPVKSQVRVRNIPKCSQEIYYLTILLVTERTAEP